MQVDGVKLTGVARMRATMRIEVPAVIDTRRPASAEGKGPARRDDAWPNEGANSSDTDAVRSLPPVTQLCSLQPLSIPLQLLEAPAHQVTCSPHSQLTGSVMLSGFPALDPMVGSLGECMLHSLRFCVHMQSAAAQALEGKPAQAGERAWLRAAMQAPGPPAQQPQPRAAAAAPPPPAPGAAQVRS